MAKFTANSAAKDAKPAVPVKAAPIFAKNPAGPVRPMITTIAIAANTFPIPFEPAGSSVIIKVYKNSVLQGSQTTSVSGWQPLGTSVGDDDVYIGGIPTQPYWYEGKIAICRLYKGKALTAAEVKQNYDTHRGRFGL